MVELGKEHVNALLLVLLLAALQRQLYYIDSREAQVSATNAGALAKAVLEHSGAASHCCHLVNISLGVVGLPVGILIERCVQIQEVREESASRNLAGQLVEVEVAVLGQIVHTALLLPNLYWEDGSLAVAHTLVGAQQNLAHNAATLGTGVGSVVNAREHHLITTATVNGVHVVYERLHGLVHTTHGLVDGVLTGALATLQSVERFLQIVHQRLVVHILKVFAVEILHSLQLLNVAHTNVRSQIEVECRNSLSAVHLVLSALHRYTCQHAGRLNALCGARCSVTGSKSVLQDVIQRVLHAGERLCWVVILVVNVQIVMLHGVATLL